MEGEYRVQSTDNLVSRYNGFRFLTKYINLHFVLLFSYCLIPFKTLIVSFIVSPMGWSMSRSA